MKERKQVKPRCAVVVIRNIGGRIQVNQEQTAPTGTATIIYDSHLTPIP